MGIIRQTKQAAARALLAKDEHGKPDLTEFRIKTCEACREFDAEERTCTVCGCFIDIKAELKTNRNPLKLRTEITHCPFGRWNDKDTANHYREIDGKPLLP